MDENEVKGICSSLAYALKSAGGTDTTTENLIISEFFHALNRRGWIRNELVDPQIEYTKDRLAYYRSPESLRTRTPQTDMHTSRTNPLNRWRSQARF